MEHYGNEGVCRMADEQPMLQRRWFSSSEGTTEIVSSVVRGMVLLTVFAMTRIRFSPMTLQHQSLLDLAGAIGAIYVIATTFPRWLPGDAGRKTSILTVLDIFLISLIVYATGGVASEYYVLYYLPILQASVRLDFKDAMSASLLSSATYLFLGLIAGPDSSVTMSSALRTATFGASVVLFALFFALLARETKRYRELSNWYRQMSEAKSDVVSVVAHDIKTPITAILGFCDLLRRHDLSDEDRENFLNLVSHESERLSRMVDDFLDLSRIEAGRLKLRLMTMDLVPIVERHVQLNSGVGTHAVTLQVIGDPPPVRADRDRVEQILENLLNNAMKYSPTGTPIEVTVTPPAPGHGETVMVSVTDHGRGISAERIPSLFEKWSRNGLAQNTGPRGTGLGLAITKSLIEVQGGRLLVESEPGHGSTFSFFLPVAPEAAAAVVEKGADRRAEHQPLATQRAHSG